jgi:pimeloyl-ACP methyl ester carboxylesterase
MQIKTRLSSILLVGQLALLYLVLTSCQKDADTTMKVSDPIVDSVESADGVMIHYEVLGAGEPTLVFVHGWCGDRSYWKNQVVEFSKTYQVVTVDLGGHGESGLGREDWTMAAFGADVASVVNKVNPNKVVLTGHSMGGKVNLEAARQLSGRIIGVIGVDCYKEFGTGYSREQVTETSKPFRDDFVTSVDGFVRGMFPKDADSALVNWVVADVSSAPQGVALSAFENYFRTDVQAILKDVRVPIRAINCDSWGELTDVESNQQHAASFELKLMTGVGHLLHLEDPATFNQLLHETLDELTGKSGAPADKE